MQCFSVKGTGHFGDFGLNLGGVSRASGTKIESVTPQGLVPFLQFASCPCQPDQGAPFSGLGEKVHIVTLEISLVVK